MPRVMVLIWTCSMLLFTANLIEGIPGLGVNWGHIASHNLEPTIVAKLLKDNGINKLKLFDSDPSIVKKFSGTGIEIMIGIQNKQLANFSESLDSAKSWVEENVTPLCKADVNIKYVSVGNEVFLTFYNGSFVNSTFPALKNIQKALNEAGVGDKVKVTTALNADVYDSGFQGPSGGNFRDDVRDLMVDIVKFFDANKSPFVVNIYPFINVYQTPTFPIDYAFFDGIAQPIIDNGLEYTNMFDANYDTLVVSLKKAGVPNVKIIIGEIGWPTDGDVHANITMAKRFYDGFLKKMASNKGTPLRPGPIDAYLFSLMDEDLKSTLPGTFERHWGIFRYDGQPKFPIDFTGKNGKLVVGAKGVEYLPTQWCVFNKNNKNKTLVSETFDWACLHGDCTSLGDGSSCNNLDDNGKFSYAFNMYYQMNNQLKEACDFDGLGTIVKKNASEGTCLFPVQIATPKASTLGPAPAPTSTHIKGPASTITPASASIGTGKRFDFMILTSVVGGLLILFILF
ncbi:hypothetical protein F0562_003352 [Nyssa sinensis]|uniref:glucan endo-1,3-beta-D-glucosidase n=1 Tax=Nyssa sinensis TaxID=561372 RepID=A0A5J5BUX5_9ASTE|nr:hypothetical protein F0562_003352 [Nyssa sinensis]